MPWCVCKDRKSLLFVHLACNKVFWHVLHHPFPRICKKSHTVSMYIISNKITTDVKHQQYIIHIYCTLLYYNYITPMSSYAHTKKAKNMIIKHFKDDAYYCYCTYVLRISRYSDFLSQMLTNTGIFLRGLKLSGESRS